MTDQAYRVGEESRPDPEPEQGPEVPAVDRPQASSAWMLAYALVLAGGGELAALFGDLGESFRTWAALTLYCTLIAVMGLLAFGVLRTRPRRTR